MLTCNLEKKWIWCGLFFTLFYLSGCAHSGQNEISQMGLDLLPPERLDDSLKKSTDGENKNTYTVIFNRSMSDFNEKQIKEKFSEAGYSIRTIEADEQGIKILFTKPGSTEELLTAKLKPNDSESNTTKLNIYNQNGALSSIDAYALNWLVDLDK